MYWNICHLESKVVSLSARHWRIQMTSKEIRLRDAKLYQEAMNEALIGDDPEIWISRHGLEMSLGIAMDGISDYIDACFWLNDNPLQHLRKHFPGFIWGFHEDVSPNRLVSVIVVADYIWVTGLEIGDGFVTATQIGRTNHLGLPKRRVLCFLPEKSEHSGWNQTIRTALSAYVPGIRFVLNSNNKIADTIIS